MSQVIVVPETGDGAELLWGNTKEKVAERTGLEPATPGVTGRYSNQLNYRSAVFL